MKKLILAICIATALSACGGGSKKAKTITTSASNTPMDVQAIAANADVAAHKIKKDKKQQEIIAYFDAAGNLIPEAISGGYYRKFLGRNKQGHAIVQDYYQDSHTKQTNPMVVPDDENLQSFDSAVMEGRIVWYSPDGRVTQFMDYHQGLVSRAAYYNDNGLLVLETEGDNSEDPKASVRVRGVYDNGNTMFENHQVKDTSESVFYYETGQKMWHGVSNSETIHAWTRDGKPVELSEIANDVSDVEQKANELMRRYLAD